MSLLSRRSLLLCAAAALPAASHPALAQLRGPALKQALANAQVVQGRFQVRWLPDGTIAQVQREDGGVDISRVDPVTNVTTPLFPDSVTQSLIAQYNHLSGQTVTKFPFKTLRWDHDGHLLLFKGGDDAQYLFDLDTRTLRKLLRPAPGVPENADALMRDLARSQLVNGSFSPDYSQIAYVHGYDLYVMNTTTGVETQLTTGGSDSLMSGRPDWVYPEELSQTEAFWWSPDGHKIAYLQFDERPVTPFHITHGGTSDELQRYPVAGAANPIVKLFVLDLDTHQTVEVATKSSSNVYIVRPTWTQDGTELLYQRLNRHQDTLQLLAANPTTGAVRTILTETDAAFVNLRDDGTETFGATPPPLHFLKDGKRFFWPSERSGWTQWYLYTLQGKQLAQVTSGQRVYGSIAAVDEAKGVMYVTAYTADGQEQQLFSARLDGSKMTQLTQNGGVHTIDIDPTAHFYTDAFSSPTHTSTAELRTIDGKPLRQIGSVTYNLPANTVHPPEEVVVKAADGVTRLYGHLYKPAGFDRTKKYPLIVHVYGGPTVQLVQRDNDLVDDYQVEAQDGYMVWVMDNRGTPNRGRAFERATYLKLGQTDLDDQATAVRQLVKTHPYIDATRVGITGGSYGGYMTALALLRYPEVFQVGVAESAVTDWRNYDSIYTERYMRLPEENGKGYDKGSTLVYADKLRGHLLIMHGGADNNVHLENMTQLVDSLHKAGKDNDVETKLFPDARHGVPGGDLEAEFMAKYLNPVPVS
ncbi:MAG TPA: DPP IV N-terminal domain-containing protein [Gemmatimonadaceae bacterium]|jgi:dipeptidyl-peptidase-4|nr:DPP IV N-terminal domain-containing protein [Gemmatimonadaceae bacterium]